MVAITIGTASNATPATATAVKTPAAAPAKGFFSRFLEAVMEARMRQAQREIRLYTKLELPVAKIED